LLLNLQIRGVDNMSQEFNPYQMWKDFYTQSSAFMDNNMKENFPSQGIGQILEMNLQFKKMLDETTEKYLEFVNLPTKKDLAKISSQIVNVDAKVDDLEELLEETKDNHADPIALQTEMTNLKNDVENIDKKLNEILTLLKA
jgi:polyhydroxyalkanoic acid synthase PhaR subunit